MGFRWYGERNDTGPLNEIQHGPGHGYIDITDEALFVSAMPVAALFKETNQDR